MDMEREDKEEMMKQRQLIIGGITKGTVKMKLRYGLIKAIPAMVILLLASTAVFAAGPALELPGQIIPATDGTVVVPVQYISNGNKISTITFSIDYDENLFSLNSADSDDDGIPDAIKFSLPKAFQNSVSLDVSDTDGEVDILIADVMPPLNSMPDGTIVSITFQAKATISQGVVVVRFSNNPSPSFGSTTGQSVQN
jgi:hypothetical protein